ncbi:MAG: 3-oxoacyl-ACP reductase FabG [Deltaproteobacteria bacterium]|nr:3-oxoacyl-ACP reductase FabG [Deltaproteobacteria bacterium]
MYDLSGKVALVTGSSMGLGRAFALDLAKAGASLVVNNRKGGDLAGAVVKEIEDMGREAALVPCDIGDPESVENMVDTVLKRFKRLDILINNAGISIDGTTVKLDSESWDRVLKTNIYGAFYCSKYCLPSMIESKWGRVVNITSVVGQVGAMGTPAYTASKSALIGFTKTLAKEVARKGITVNCISLGYFKGGGLLDTVPDNIAEGILAGIPMGRWGKPEEITSAINYLVSDPAAYITGQTININGGFFM